MSKTFKYTKTIERVYLANTDEYEEFGDDFEYEVDDEELLDAVVKFVYRDYFRVTALYDSSMMIKSIKQFIDDFELLDILVKSYEDRLHDYFEDDAMRSY